jgi:molybdenum transport protein
VELGNWVTIVAHLKQDPPEKKVIVEADNVEEALTALNAQTGIVQMAKCTSGEFIPILAQR